MPMTQNLFFQLDSIFFNGSVHVDILYYSHRNFHLCIMNTNYELGFEKSAHLF
jgi:hypothetical protein